MLLVIVLGGLYALVGYSIASSHTSAAQAALDSTLGHRVDFSQSIANLDDGFVAFSATAFDPVQYKTEVDGFVSSSRAQSANMAADDKQLESAARKLGDSRWLIALSTAGLDRAATRVQHARKALAAGKTITADYLQFGQFLEVYSQVLLDVGDVGSSSTTDLSAAMTTVSSLQTHVGSALGLSNAPGIPPEVHELLVDLQTVASDFQAALSALSANDDAAYATARAKGDKDLAVLGAVQTSKVGDEVNSFYQPYFDTYRQELQLAAR